MKKVLIIVLIAVVAGSSVFALDLSLGVMQNFLDTSFIADAEFNHFGVEGSVGFPLVWGTSALIGAISDGKDIDFSDGVAMVLMPGVMVNGYWKAIDTKHFDLRLGLQTDVIGLFTDDVTSVLGLWGASLGLNFKFGERFSANITGTVPAALPLSAIGDDASKFGGFAYVNGTDDIGDIFLVIFGQLLPGALSEMCRVSLKWKI